MARRSAIVVLLLAMLLPACNVQHVQQVRAKSLMKQWGTKCKAAADLLAGVKDAASAKAAAPRLDVLVKEMDQIQEQIDRVYDPTEVDPGDEGPVMEEVGQNIVQMHRLFAEVARIGQQPEITAALGPAWDRLSGYDVLNHSGLAPQ
jgi:hypothetical protein